MMAQSPDAVQNHSEDVSTVYNPTKKKRRLNLPYQDLILQATETFNNALAGGTRSHYASVIADLMDFFKSKNETQALIYDINGKDGIDFSHLKAEHVVSFFDNLEKGRDVAAVAVVDDDLDD